MVEIKKGTMELLDTLDVLYTKCKADMERQNIYQWFDSYPNRETVSWNLEHGYTYCLLDEAGTVVGVVVLNTWQSSEWDLLQWTEAPRGCLVVHGLAVHPEHQGKGYGKQLLAFSEELAREWGHDGVRLDAYSGNPAALRMYESNGYTGTGAIYFNSKPQPYNWYNCYEKMFAKVEA